MEDANSAVKKLAASGNEIKEFSLLHRNPYPTELKDWNLQKCMKFQDTGIHMFMSC